VGCVQRTARRACDANAKIVVNESAEIIGGKDFTRSSRLWTRFQAGHGHDKTIESLERRQRAVTSRPAIWLGEVLLASRPIYTLLCIYKSSKRTTNLPAHCAGISILLVKSALRERALPRRIKNSATCSSDYPCDRWHHINSRSVRSCYSSLQSRAMCLTGSVKVTKQLLRDEFEYRIRGPSGEHERVAGVSELTWAQHEGDDRMSRRHARSLVT
jgi:hypothetical protein